MPLESNPKDQLDELTKRLQEKEQDNARATAEIEYIKLRIAEVTRIAGEIDQKVTAYEKAWIPLDEQRKKSESFFKAKKKLLEDTLPNEEEIKTKKNEGYRAYDRLKKEIEDLKTKVDEKQSALDAKQRDFDQKKAQYIAKLDVAGSVSKALKELQELQKQAELEDDKNNYARMYFYVLEMEDTLKQVDLPTGQQYRSLLNQLATDLEDASVAHRTAKDDLDSTIAERKKKQKEFDDEAVARRQKTVTSIPETPPVIS